MDIFNKIKVCKPFIFYSFGINKSGSFIYQVNPPLLTKILKLIHDIHSDHNHDRIHDHSIHVHIRGVHNTHSLAQHQQISCHNGNHNDHTHVHSIQDDDHIRVHSIHNGAQLQHQLRVQHQQISCHSNHNDHNHDHIHVHSIPDDLIHGHNSHSQAQQQQWLQLQPRQQQRQTDRGQQQQLSSCWILASWRT